MVNNNSSHSLAFSNPSRSRDPESQEIPDGSLGSTGGCLGSQGIPDWDPGVGSLGSMGVWDPRVGNESQTRFPEELWDSDLSAGTAAGVLEG